MTVLGQREKEDRNQEINKGEMVAGEEHNNPLYLHQKVASTELRLSVFQQQNTFSILCNQEHFQISR